MTEPCGALKQSGRRAEGDQEDLRLEEIQKEALGGVNVSATNVQSGHQKPRRFGDQFRATRVLKSGPAGETLRGIDGGDGREVVIRTMVNADMAATARLEQELAAMAGLDATGLVRPIAAGRQGGVLYSVLPYVPGVTLEACLRDRSGPLSIVEALAVGRGVLRALVDAHQHGFLHLDVRPSNVVVRLVSGLGPDGVGGGLRQATLVDFGVRQLGRVAGSRPETGLRAARYGHRRPPTSWITRSTSGRISIRRERCCSSASPDDPCSRARRLVRSCAST